MSETFNGGKKMIAWYWVVLIVIGVFILGLFISGKAIVDAIIKMVLGD